MRAFQDGNDTAWFFQVPSDDVRERFQVSSDDVKEYFQASIDVREHFRPPGMMLGNIFRLLMTKDRSHHVCSFLSCLGECVKLVTSDFVQVV